MANSANSAVDRSKVPQSTALEDKQFVQAPVYPCPKRLAVVGKGMRRNNALLPDVLQADIQRWYPWSGLRYRLNDTPLSIRSRRPSRPEAFIGWGHKKSYQRANKVAKPLKLKTLSIEDGFLRSLDSGIDSRHAVSVVVDDIGIYFDVTQPSRLEQLIVQRSKNDTQADSVRLDQARARQLMARICQEQLSKYNSVTDCPSLDTVVAEDKAAKEDAKPHVLLIDQVVGDASIKGAGANKRQFKRMLKAACRRHPQAHIWIKAHPADASGYLSRLKRPKNVRLLTQALNPIALLAQVEDVYTVSSHMGFEALMLGKTVHCYGVNWYSGWGLTEDSGAPKRLLAQVKRRRQTPKATLETLFYSAYIDYSHYVDPATKQACSIDNAIAFLITNRYWQARLDGGLTVYEFSRWKLPFVKAFVNFPRTTLFIKPKPRLKNLLHPDHFRVDYQQPLLVWGLAKRQHVQKQLQRKLGQAPSAMPSVYCMEDGFIRSNGLGATLLAPLSVVIDKQGIYYDVTQPSDLETLLRQCQALTPAQTSRVHALQHKLLTQRVSKYNVGATVDGARSQQTAWIRASKASGKRRILIIGQVEDDLSVQYCGSTIKTNSELIAQVRQDNPNAYLIYKPHPDVEAGLRTGKVSADCLRQVQAVAYNTAMPDCLACIDAVHTISSLTGFEALLRGIPVSCYGVPFYAGWGLTTDIGAKCLPKAAYLRRRVRDTPLSLEQLLYCALIRYPLYRLPDGYGLAQVEQVIDHLYPPSSYNTGNDKDKDNDNSKDNAQRSPHTERLKSGKTLSPSATITALSHVSLQLKRRAATHFMQQRHHWLQRLRHLSR